MTAVMDLPAAPADDSRPVEIAYTPALPIWVLQGVALAIVALKLAFSAVVPPGYDDSYYWLWGQHLQWSYLDHAPMVGWGAWASSRLLGWNPLALHLMPLASLALDALVLRSWSRRIVPDQWQHYFWAAFAVLLASPLMMAMTSILYPDQALIAACLGALHFLALFLADWRVGRRRYRYLYLGALLLGVAMLSKYNGALVGLGFCGVVLFDGRLRPLFRSPHLYLAGLLAALFLVPIVGWNVAHDFASLRLHSSDRFAGYGAGFTVDGMKRWSWQTALYFSPFLLWPLARSLLARAPGPEGAMLGMGRWIFFPCTLALLALATWIPGSTQVAPHWEIVAFLPFLLLAPLFVRSPWLMGLHLGFGTIVAALTVVYFVFSPLPTDALHISDAEANRDYGQEQLAAAIGADKWIYGASFIGTRRYNVAAKLAWGAGSDRDLISLSSEIDQFYFWHDVSQYAGKSGIVLEEQPIIPGQLDSLFQSVSYIGPVTPTRFGRPLTTYQLYLGRGYRGHAPRP